MGIEPTTTDYEAVILPLNYESILEACMAASVARLKKGEMFLSILRLYIKEDASLVIQ